jgi:hypothetical protein
MSQSPDQLACGLAPQLVEGRKLSHEISQPAHVKPSVAGNSLEPQARDAARPAGSILPVAKLISMAKTWILDTETKGTGAHVVPLEEALQKPSPREDLALVTLEGPPRPAEPAEPLAPMSFKIVDVRSSHVLAEGIGARAAVELLEEVGSVVDIRIYVWARPARRWRLLTLDEQKALWGFRGRRTAGAASADAR